MSTIARLILAGVAFTVTTSCSYVRSGVNLAYFVTIGNHPKEILVSLAIRNISRKNIVLETPAQANLMNVADLRVVDGKNRSVRVDYIATAQKPRNVTGKFEFGRWHIQNGDASEITVTYRVRLGHKERGQYFGYLGDDFGLLSGYNLFLIPAQNNVRTRRIKVEFQVPDTWSVAYPSNIQGHDALPILESENTIVPILNSTIGLGHLSLDRREISGSEIRFFTYEKWPSAYRSSLVTKSLAIVKQHIQLMGGMPQGDYTVIFVPRVKEDSGTVFVPASFSVQGQSMAPATRSDWIHFAEGIFRRYTTFNRNRLNTTDSRNRWYEEGITGFYAVKALDAVYADARAAEERFGYLYSLLTSFFDKSPSTGLPIMPFQTNLISKNPEKISVKSLRFYKTILAPVTAYLLDRQIRLRTRGTKNLDFVVNYQYKKSRGFKQVVDLLADLRNSTGYEFTDFFQKRVYNPSFVEPPTYLPFTENRFNSRPRHSPTHQDGLTQDLTIVLSGGTKGFLENCGCAANQSGGIARRGTVIKQIRSSDPDVIILDTGDAFPGVMRYDSLTRLEIQSYLEGMNSIGFHALNASHTEILATELISETKPNLTFPILSTNLVKKDRSELIYPPFIVREVNGIRVGIVGFSPPVPFSMTQVGLFDYATAELDFVDPVVAVRRSVKELRPKCDLVLLLTGATYPHTIYGILDQIEGIDLVVGTNAKVFHPYDFRDLRKGYVVKSPDGYVNDTLVLFVRGGPYALEWVNLRIDVDGKIVGWEREAVHLTDEVEDDPEVKILLDRFYAEIEKNTALWDATDRLYGDESLEQSIAEGNGYIGVDACASCHGEIATEWRGTKHATAYNTLIKAHRNYYPRCVVCHTVGFGYETGYKLGSARSSQLAHVQCETCHGPGKNHVAYVKGLLPPTDSVRESRFIRANVTEKQCVACHNNEHSPGFDYDAHAHQGCAPMKMKKSSGIGSLRLAETPAGLAAANTLRSEGETIYMESGCARCHGLDRKGSPTGPVVNRLSANWTRQELIRYIGDPEGSREARPRLKALAAQYNAPMPSFDLDAETLNALTKYLLQQDN